MNKRKIVSSTVDIAGNIDKKNNIIHEDHKHIDHQIIDKGIDDNIIEKIS